MWYLVWFLGVLFACALSVVTLLWLEYRKIFDQDINTCEKNEKSETNENF